MGINLKLKDNANLSFMKELSYIQTSGTQYIDTGVKPSSTIKFVMEFEWVSFPNNEPKIAYGCDAGVYDNNAFALQYSSGQSKVTIYHGSSGSASVTVNTNTRYRIEHKNGEQKFYTVSNNTAIISSQMTTTFSSPQNIYIAALNRGGSTTVYPACIKIYYCKIYDNNVLVKDFVPCYYKEYGLYDKINEVFYKNKGTGEITGGSFVSTILQSNISSVITSAYVKDCLNINGLSILRQCTNLTRVRLDIGNATGPLQELLSYSGYGGFNDNYEIPNPDKPKLVGTWTINYYYSNAMLAEAQAAFDGLTIVEDTAYNWDSLVANDTIAVQTIDDTAPNYNPAVAIILQGQSKGTTLSEPLISGKGRWFLTKGQAAGITTVNEFFVGKNSVTDVDGIVSANTSSTYNFSSFNEFQYFTSITEIGRGGPNYSTIGGNFRSCTNLEEITLPSTCTTIGLSTGGPFDGCTSLESLDLSNVTHIYTNVGSYNGATSCSNLKTVIYNNNVEVLLGHSNSTNLELSVLPSNLKYLGVGNFRECRKITITEIPSSLISLGGSTTYDGAFASCTGIPYLHFLSSTPPTITSSSSAGGPFYGTSFKIYVGTGEVEADDDAILQAYQGASGWSTYSSRLDTWYNYLHPQS